MIEELWKNSAIIAKRNVDSNQIPISVPLIEYKQIIDVHSCIVLNQLPDENIGVNIEGFNEVFDIEDVTTTSFKVDYSNGVLYFHPYNIGKSLSVFYSGTGCTLLSASRIYTKYDKDGNVLETLEELIDKAKLQLQAIESLGGAVEVINRIENANETGSVLHENLTNDIEVGTPLNENLEENIAEGTDLIPQLDERNATATQKKKDLDQSINTATETNTILANTNTTATQINLTLEQTMDEAKNDIDTINATGNKSLIIGSSQFINNEYTWQHDMNSENLTVNFIDTETKEPLIPDYKIVDSNNILVRNSVEHPNIKVILSASYYQGNSLFGTNVEEFVGDSVGMSEKSVRLKNDNGVYENPVTKSDVVFMPDGSTKLTEKIKDIDERIIKEEIKDFFNIIKNSRSKLIGHRGLNAIYPENTAFAVEKAFEIGMFGVEVDIYQTLDGEFVIIHDDTVDRTTNGTGRVEELNYTYISDLKIDGGNGNPSYYTDLKIPKLEDLLKILQRYDKYLFLELKGTIYDYNKLFSLIDRYKVKDKIIFLSFNSSLLNQVRSKDRNIMLGYNANMDNSTIDVCASWGNTFISSPVNYVTEELIRYAHENNVGVISYSATNIGLFREQLSLGVDLMTTDYLIEGGNF